MKFELNDRLVGRIIGISMAAAVAVTVSMASEILNIKNSTNAVTEDNLAMADNIEDDYYNAGDAKVVPFSDNVSDEPNITNQDMGLIQDIYEELVVSEKQKNETDSTVPQQVTRSTTSSLEEVVTSTTVTQTSSKKTESTTTAVPSVSNGKREFNYSDVSIIASDLKTLQDFVEELRPTSFCWDTSGYSTYGYVQISLISSYGNVTLDVRPVEEYTDGEQYLIDNQAVGSMSASSIADLDWYNNNKEGGCNICSVTWITREFAISPVRGINLGTKLADLTDSYLCVNGGATTLYKASDVITDQNKLNALLAVENAYTFVGGRIYTTESYIEKYYSGKGNSYRFADSSFVVQYGCNSIMDYNYTTGSWIIEYAIKDDVVVGITFMNKSYYQTTSNSNVTDDTISTTASTTAFEQLFGE